jgi:multiple sugar transport system permease protein
MLLNSKILSPGTRALFRVVYVLPWVFTATIIAVLWRLMLNPNGIINYLFVWAGLASEEIEWLSSKQVALHAVTFINIWAGYPFYMVSLLAGLQGIPIISMRLAPLMGPTMCFRHITLPQLRPIILGQVC